MTDLEAEQCKKILDEFQAKWDKPQPWRPWPVPFYPETDSAPVKTETVIGADEILEGFTPRK